MRKNCLPEKLSLMRKYYQLSLSDIAMRLNVPVTEYMNWENGNTLCDTENLKKIAEIYHVKLQDLVDNTKIVSISYLDKINDSVELMTFRKDAKEVPFREDVADHIMATSVIVTNVPAELTQTTMSIPASTEHTTAVTSTIDLGETKVMSRDDLQETTVNEIVEDTVETEPVKPGIPKKIWGIAGAVLAGIVLLVLAVTFFNKETTVDDIEVSLSNVNRIALGDTYSIYIDANGELVTNGDTMPSLSKFKDIVQVSAWDGHLTGLKKNGKVVCTGSNEACDVGAWNHITMIASGRNHTVGLTDEGTVVCTGNSSACEVENWKEVTAVYAGDGITIARTKGNNLLVSGNFDEKKTIPAQTKIK